MLYQVPIPGSPLGTNDFFLLGSFSYYFFRFIISFMQLYLLPVILYIVYCISMITDIADNSMCSYVLPRSISLYLFFAIICDEFSRWSTHCFDIIFWWKLSYIVFVCVCGIRDEKSQKKTSFVKHACNNKNDNKNIILQHIII